MPPTNREIAIGYLDDEVLSGSVSSILKRLKKAFKKKVSSTLDFNIIVLEVDPARATVTLHQHWFACEEEVFSFEEIVDLINHSRRRGRSR